MTPTLRVPALNAAYPVVIRKGLLQELPGLLRDLAPAPRYAVVSDLNVSPLYASALVEALATAGGQPLLLTFPPGEASKNRTVWAALTDTLLEGGFGRDGVVVALGGGVTGDLAGFVAATYMRGVPVVQVPTSLVAMIDASVGGKTGLDVPGGKNLVGAFHPPLAVLADPRVILTLPRPERARGLAEAVKHGAIRDRSHMDRISALGPALLDADPDAVEALVAESVAIKADIVALDEREGGLRRILNFGHTLAHAVESVSRFAVSHGEAVAMGMVLEARLGERLGTTRAGTADALARVLGHLELTVTRPAGLDDDALVLATRTDKKGAEGRARYVLLRTLGETDPGDGGWVHEVEDRDVRAVLAGW